MARRKRDRDDFEPDQDVSSTRGTKRSRASSPSRESDDGADSSQQTGDDSPRNSESGQSEDSGPGWSEQWDTRLQELMARGATEPQQEEYRDVFDSLDSLARELSEKTPDPPPISGRPADYIQKISQDFRNQALGWCDETFADGLRRADDWNERLLIHQQNKKMNDAVRDGQWPWTLNEDNSVGIDLTEWVRSLGVDRRPGDPERLEGIWTLHSIPGQGGYGYAALWDKRDAGNMLLDRVIIKDVYLSERSWADKGDYSAWFDNRQGKPREASTMQLLNGLVESFNVVKCLAYREIEKLWMYRVYQEFCPNGTLNEMLYQHKDRQAWVSPHVLWAVFEALVSVACLMNDGKLPTKRGPNGWLAMIHSDIKPENVFLTFERSPIQGVQSWPGLPVPKLGDFGIAHYADRITLEEGTKGYRAPERVESDDETIKSDLWSIARIILSLMERDQVNDDDSFEEDAQSMFSHPDVYQLYAKECGKLVQLVRNCLSSDPDDRPEPSKLWEDIQQEIAKSPTLNTPALKYTSDLRFKVLCGGPSYAEAFQEMGSEADDQGSEDDMEA